MKKIFLLFLIIISLSSFVSAETIDYDDVSSNRLASHWDVDGDGTATFNVVQYEGGTAASKSTIYGVDFTQGNVTNRTIIGINASVFSHQQAGTGNTIRLCLGNGTSGVAATPIDGICFASNRPSNLMSIERYISGGYTLMNSTAGLCADETHEIAVLEFDNSTDRYYVYCNGNLKLTIDGNTYNISNNTEAYWSSRMGGANGEQIRIKDIYLELVDIPGSEFTIDVKSQWSGSSITNITAIVNGSTYTNTTGSVIHTNLTNINALINITISSNNWFNKTYIDYNISSDLSATLNQSQINFSCYEKITNNSLTCLNATISPDIGIYNFSINVTGYYSKETTNTVISALDNKTINVTGFYTSIVSLKTNFLTGSGTNDCNYTVTGITYPAYTELLITNVTNTSVNLINGVYSVLADCSGYAFSYKNITVTTATHTLTFNLFTTNSVNITFYDSGNGSIINDRNITVQFLGTTAQTNTTETGNLYVDLLSPDEYTIIANANDYRQGSYIFTLTNKSTTNINMYLDKISNTSLVLITVRDKYSKDPVVNSLVTLQRYINNSWITEQILKTDFNGQTEGWFVVSTEFYNFLVEVDGTTYFGIINSNQNKKVIYTEDVANGIVIEIDTNPNTQIISYQSSSYNLITSLNFVNTSNSTGYFTFFWDDTNNAAREIYLNITVDNVINCSKTANSESGSVTCNVNVSNSSDITYFVGNAYVDGVLINSITGRLGTNQALKFNWGATGWFISLFSVIIGFTLFLSVPSISILAGSGIFVLLLIINVMFKGIGAEIMLLIMFIAWLIARIPSKSGVNS